MFQQSLHWSQVGHKKQELDDQVDQIARALDGVLLGFGVRGIEPFQGSVS